MTKKSGDRQRLKHMLTAIDDVLGFTAGVTKAESTQNRMMQFACVRGLEIVGQAANHLSTTLHDVYPQIPWREIVEMRNFAAHQYFAVQSNVIRDAIRQDLPVLKP